MEMWQLEQRRDLPLELKEILTTKRIEEFYNRFLGNVYISFSGGKDSTVLLNIARKRFKDIPAVFSDTGLEYPEIKEFIGTVDNVTTIKPKISFLSVIKKYGYPLISKEVSQRIEEAINTHSEKLRNKRLNGDENKKGAIPKKWKFLIDAPFKISSKCCSILKKNPFKKYEKETGRHPIVGTMAVDSSLRKQSYLKHGCNSFESKRPISTPLGFWTEQDIWEYIRKYKLNYSTIYDKGFKNTGCMFCMFAT